MTMCDITDSPPNHAMHCTMFLFLVRIELVQNYPKLSGYEASIIENFGRDHHMIIIQ